VVEGCYWVDQHQLERWQQLPQEWLQDIHFTPVINAEGHLAAYEISQLNDAGSFTGLGLSRGDQVVALNGQDFAEPGALAAEMNAILQLPVLDVELIRNGQLLALRWVKDSRDC